MLLIPYVESLTAIVRRALHGECESLWVDEHEKAPHEPVYFRPVPPPTARQGPKLYPFAAEKATYPISRSLLHFTVRHREQTRVVLVSTSTVDVRQCRDAAAILDAFIFISVISLFNLTVRREIIGEKC